MRRTALGWMGIGLAAVCFQAAALQASNLDSAPVSAQRAAHVGLDPVIEFLVERGAKLNVKDNFQQTPLSIAEGLLAPGIVDFSKKPFGPHENAAKLLLKLSATPDNSVTFQSVLK